jgi:hypothetical protein
MEIEPFFIEFEYKNETELAEVKPCCQQENVYYYDISIRNQYQFTITPNPNHQSEHNWRVALKNADKEVDQEFVSVIGEQIEKHYIES